MNHSLPGNPDKHNACGFTAPNYPLPHSSNGEESSSPRSSHHFRGERAELLQVRCLERMGFTRKYGLIQYFPIHFGSSTFTQNRCKNKRQNGEERKGNPTLSHSFHEPDGNGTWSKPEPPLGWWEGAFSDQVFNGSGRPKGFGNYHPLLQSWTNPPLPSLVGRTCCFPFAVVKGVRPCLIGNPQKQFGFFPLKRPTRIEGFRTILLRPPPGSNEYYNLDP